MAQLDITRSSNHKCEHCCCLDSGSSISRERVSGATGLAVTQKLDERIN